MTTPATTAMTTAAMVPIQNDFHFSPVIKPFPSAYSAGWLSTLARASLSSSSTQRP
jgi:hypothetical protein